MSDKPNINMKNIIVILALLLLPLSGYAQDELLKELDSTAAPQTDYVSATFKATRVVTGQSIEQNKEGQLEFRISHRFGKLNSGVDNLWGLDQSNIYFDLQYGVKDWLELGIGRTSFDKNLNGFAKLRLLRQSTGADAFPVSVSYLAGADLTTMPEDASRKNFLSSRFSYTHQIIIAKKITNELSLQIAPTLIHRNLVPTALDDNNLFAVGFGGRYKLSNRVSVNAEYYYVARPTWNVPSDYKDPLSFGVDIETGGHVFQIILSNSLGMVEKQFIGDTQGRWNKGDIHLGFNISRSFTIYGD